jgi:uncharacterized protein YpmS
MLRIFSFKGHFMPKLILPLTLLALLFSISSQANEANNFDKDELSEFQQQAQDSKSSLNQLMTQVMSQFQPTDDCKNTNDKSLVCKAIREISKYRIATPLINWKM